MAEGKRYYWLKLKDDLFTSIRIKKLRRMAGGDTYLIIYLKLQLKAIKNDGVVSYKGYEQDFIDELALDLDEKPDNVRVTLMYLLSCGLAETEDNVNFFFPYAIENVGSEGASAQRVREFRERQTLQRNTGVTPVKQIGNGEIEKEKDLEKDTRDKTQETDTSGFETALSDYIEHRNAMGKPLTGKGVDLVRADLEKLAPGDKVKQIAILHQSIKKGWKGVFPLKEEKKGPPIKSSYDNLPPKRDDKDDLERLAIMMGVDNGG